MKNEKLRNRISLLYNNFGRQAKRITSDLISLNPLDQYNSHSIDFKNSTALSNGITVNEGDRAVRVIDK